MDCCVPFRLTSVQKVVFELDGVDEIFGSSRASLPAVGGPFLLILIFSSTQRITELMILMAVHIEVGHSN
jgi:hypothetical protein